jgi:hypothetical protein
MVKLATNVLHQVDSYPDFDYSGAKNNEDEFKKIAELLNATTQTKSKK